MGKLDKTKQDLLDAWAANAAAGKDVGKTEYAANGSVAKKSDTDTMMETLQGELTETVLDAAMAKAKAGK